MDLEHLMQATISSEPATIPSNPLSADELRKIDAYWRAANYLSVGQIYLFDNPLLTEPLRLEHIKPRLLGHWGTTPGLNFIYAHCNRAHPQIRSQHDLHLRPRPRRSRHGRQHVSGRHLQRTFSEHHAGLRRHASGCSRSSRFPAAFPATPRPRRRARFMKAASWATRCCTPTARCSTIPI